MDAHRGTDTRLARVTRILENGIYPVIFIALAIDMLWALTQLTLSSVNRDLFYFSQWCRNFLLGLFHLSVAYYLFRAKDSTKEYPGKLLEIVLPVVATFWFMTYAFVEILPDQINPMIIPYRAFLWAILPGIGLNLVGLGISIAGVFQLNRSFGISVKVNDVITTGVYAIVRHPIYAGYLLASVGFMLMNPRLFHVVAYAIAILFQIWRARIEEEKLARYSHQYRQYIKRVPFIIPKLFKSIERLREVKL